MKRLPGESTHDEVLTVTQGNDYSKVDTYHYRCPCERNDNPRTIDFLNTMRIFFFATPRSGGLSDEETEAATDLVRTYPNRQSAELIQKLTDLPI